MLSEQKMSMKLILIGAVLLIAAVKGEYFYFILPKKKEAKKKKFLERAQLYNREFCFCSSFASLYCFGHATHVNIGNFTTLRGYEDVG